MKYFVNFSNHMKVDWNEDQKSAALHSYGTDEIIDYPFPAVQPEIGEIQIEEIAEKCVNDIIGFRPEAVMAQGEFGLTFAVVTKLKEKGIPVVYACSKRNVKNIQIEDGEIKKEVIFQFVRFRQY